MAKKTIPQLQEVTDVTDNMLFVVDTGSATKKVKKINLVRSFKASVRIISVTAQLLTTDDDYVLFNTGLVSDFTSTLPAIATSDKKVIKVKNIGTGKLVMSAVDVGSTIDGAATLAVGPNQSFTLVCDGTNWFIF